MTKERGEQLAVEYGIKFLETSAKASINVEEAFFTLASDIKAKMEKRLVCYAINKYLDYVQKTCYKLFLKKTKIYEIRNKNKNTQKDILLANDQNVYCDAP